MSADEGFWPQLTREEMANHPRHGLSPRQLIHALVWTKRHLLGQLTAHEIPYIRPFLRPTDVCIDVGAEGGSWTVPLARLVPQGHVVAFEALPYYAAVLTLTLRFLRIANAAVINCAVTDHLGEARLIWKDSQGRRLRGLTHVSAIDGVEDQAVSVRSITLDASILSRLTQRVRFVKCDVEGVELLVLRGAEQTIAKWRPLIYCEVNADYCKRYGHTSQEVFEFFEHRRYWPYLIARGLVPLNARAVWERGDVLFIPEEIDVGMNSTDHVRGDGGVSTSEV